MAVTTLPDGRHICYWNDPVTKKRCKGYFGRGPEAEARAHQRDKELGLRRGQPPQNRYGPKFSELATIYEKAQPYIINADVLEKVYHLEDFLPDTDKRLIGHKRNSNVKAFILKQLYGVQGILKNTLLSAKEKPISADYPLKAADEFSIHCRNWLTACKFINTCHVPSVDFLVNMTVKESPVLSSYCNPLPAVQPLPSPKIIPVEKEIPADMFLKGKTTLNRVKLLG